jgi:ABC-2 type transport system ATP-binding protein
MTTTSSPGHEVFTTEDPGGTEAPAIALRNLTKRYGAGVALSDVTVDVPVGSICGLVGPNGAGKSTLMSIVATLLRPTAGHAYVFGHHTSRVEAVRPLIGYVPDVLGTYAGLSVEEYLLFFADAYEVPADRRAGLVASLLELVDLESKRHADVNTLSRGMKQRIGLARGLVHEPRLLLLDEPASGLDPRARVELREILLQLNSGGVTVLISSHILSELEEMCSDALILERGHLVGLEDLGTEPVRQVRIGFLDGESELFDVADEEAQADLVARLVAQGRKVITVEPQASRLEDRFMRMTSGEVN